MPVWYGSINDPRPVSSAALVRSALELATGPERIAFAHSYSAGFSAPSGILHFSTGPDRRPLDDSLLRVGTSQLVLLGIAIARRVAELADLTDQIALTPAASVRTH